MIELKQSYREGKPISLRSSCVEGAQLSKFCHNDVRPNVSRHVMASDCHHMGPEAIEPTADLGSVGQ